MIYLDNASTTQVDPEVIEAMMPYLTNEYGNPGTLYSFGRNAKKAVEKARAQVASFIGAHPEQIIFTSGGTESNNTVFFATADRLKEAGKTHIISTNSEHDSVIKAINALCIKQGFHSCLVHPNAQGIVSLSDIISHVNELTGMISVMYVNNEVGSENPVEEIGAFCKSHNILYHTDCVQAAGSHKIDVDQIGCDFLSISSHKIHGVKGIGALYVRDSSQIHPLINGGERQEFGFRGGTENVPAIVGFGKACELASKRLHDTDVHTSTLKQIFYNCLIDELKTLHLEDIVHINGDMLIKHGKILNLRFDKVDGETLLLLLDAKNICVSAGSACRSRESKPSRVLTSMGISPEDARNSIRISFSRMNTEQEVETAARTIAQCVMILR
jgi:cysteine desulfurase